MLGQGLLGDEATGCCAVHLSPIVTVLFCLVCALDCVTGEVRRSNQALSNGPRSPAAGKTKGLSGKEREGEGQELWLCLPGAPQGAGTGPGMAGGRQRPLHELGENLGPG